MNCQPREGRYRKRPFDCKTIRNNQTGRAQHVDASTLENTKRTPLALHITRHHCQITNLRQRRRHGVEQAFGQGDMIGKTLCLQNLMALIQRTIGSTVLGRQVTAGHGCNRPGGKQRAIVLTGPKLGARHLVQVHTEARPPVRQTF